MFNKLRNRFLMLNLVIISFTMLMAFTAIYFITYNNVRTEIVHELRKVSEFDRKTKESPNQRPPDLDNFQPPPDRSIAFTLLTDHEGNVLNTSSMFDMEDAFYESAKNKALSIRTNTGNFKIEDTYWTFLIKPHFDGYKMVFLDITSRQAILTHLIYTFIMVAFIMLIVIFFISRFFANRSIEPIKEAFDKQKQFIADASHELKTPLAVINTNVDVLLSNREDSIDSQAKWLNYIKSEGARMTKLTNDLLYLTQIDYSEIKMIFSDFDLSETVENVILTMEAVIFENNISLDYDLEPNLTTHGNSTQIEQVILILLDNAMKYTNIEGRVDVSLKRHHGSIMLSVTNTGDGIPEEHLDKIFDRFYRTDKSRTREKGGYGLGLAIAKAIIDQHDGKISVSSILNERTTFRVELPLHKNQSYDKI